MERGHPHAAAVGAQQRLDTRPHLLGSFIGERDGEDLFRRGMPVADEVCDPAGDDTGLSGSCTRQDQQRPTDMENSLTLFAVEAIEKLQASILLSPTSRGSSVDRR